MTDINVDIKDLLDIESSFTEDIFTFDIDCIEHELSDSDLIELREEFELDNKNNKNNLTNSSIIINNFHKILLEDKNKKNENLEKIIDDFIDLSVRFIYLKHINQKEFLFEFKTLLNNGLNVANYNKINQFIEILEISNYGNAYDIVDVAYNLGKCCNSINKKLNYLKKCKLIETDFAFKLINNTFNNIKIHIDDAHTYINSFKIIFDNAEKIEESINKKNIEYYYQETKQELLNRLILVVNYFGINTLLCLNITKMSFQEAENMSIRDLNEYYIDTIKIIKKYILSIKSKIECYDELSSRLTELYKKIE
jgi:hypothetical protein